MSILDCQGCGAMLEGCGNLPDGDLYSMEDQPFPFVPNCPPGYDCSGVTEFSMICCGKVLLFSIPSGADPGRIQSILNNAVSQCTLLLAMCTDPITKTPPKKPPSAPDDPLQLFWNRPQVCTSKCPDGNVFTYTVRQGIALAPTQAQADSLAHAIACQQAAARKICLSKITTLCCLSNAFTTTVHANGGVGPYTWEITSGALPDGLTLGGFSPNADATVGPAETIEGTPTVAGSFAFTLKVTDSNGNSMSKAYAITVNPCTVVVSYWKLDEASGSINRVDSAGSAPLQPLGVTQAGVAALIINGVEFSGAFGGSDYDTTPLASLKYTTGKGLSFWGWVRCNSTGGASLNGGPLASYVMSAFEQLYLSAGSNSDPQAFRVDTRHDTAYLNLSFNTWHFFHLFYDSVQQKYGYSIDNGADTLLPTVIVPGTTATGEVQMIQGFTAASGVVIFDEVGLVTNQKLTPTQVSYLYNCGHGRTWPIDLTASAPVCSLDFVYIDAATQAALNACIPGITGRFTRVGSLFENDGNNAWIISWTGGRWEFTALPNVIYDGPFSAVPPPVTTVLGTYNISGACGPASFTLSSTP